MDVNFWRLTPLFKDKFKNPCFSPVPIGEIINLAQYGISELATTSEVGVPILRMNNLQNDGWNLSDLKYIELGNEQLERYSLEKGDILFNRTNSKELVGKCEVFDQNGIWVFASYLIRVRVKNDIVIPQFVSDFLSTETGRLQIDRVSRQIIGMTNINAEEIRQIIIPFPPLEFQKSLISSMDIARKSRQSKIKQAEELLKGLDEYILTKLDIAKPTEERIKIFSRKRSETLNSRIDPHFHSPYYKKVLKAVKDSKFSKHPLSSLLVDIAGGATPKKGDVDLYDSSGIKFLRILNVKLNFIDLNDVKYIKPHVHNSDLLRSQLNKNDVVMTITGRVGTAATIEEEILPANINQHLVRLRVKDSSCLPKYLAAYLNTSVGNAMTNKGVSGGTRIAIDYKWVGSLPIPVPPLEIQQEIIDIITQQKNEYDKLVNEAETEWQNTKKWFEEQLLK